MIPLSKTLLAAIPAALLAMGVAAHADEFAGQASSNGWSVSVDQQTAAAQDADPTSRNSLRSHGHT